jgi:DNA-binding MarR family transcriptional regulator
MANHALDIEVAQLADNMANIDFRTRSPCGAVQSPGAVQTADSSRSNAAVIRNGSPPLTVAPAKSARRDYPPACTGQAAAHSVAALPDATHHPAAAADSNSPKMSTRESLHALLSLRELRGALFPEKLFAQPAWDMLLELLECKLRQRRISVSSLYLAAGVPPATALRRIQDMEDVGLISRVCDPSDRRRQFVELTPQTLHRLRTFFQYSGVAWGANGEARSVEGSRGD